MQKVTKAKSSLILSQPFFASILLGQELVETKEVPTMATNGETIFVNPDWTESLTLLEVEFVLAHEVMHCVFEHMHRRGARDPQKWNIAADYIINDILVAERIGVMPKQGLHNPNLVQRGNGTAEGVYGLLPDDPPGSDGGGTPKPGESGGALDDLLDSAPDESGRNQKAAEMKVRIIQAKNAAKMAGRLSAGLERLVNDATKSKTNWKEVLRNYLTQKCRTDLSYAKPKRRFLAEDIVLPSLVGERMGQVVIAVDCSGSIDENVLQKFSTEVNGILEDTGTKEVTVLYFDTEILRVQSHNADESGPLKLTPIGGGGTAFSPIWESIAKLNLDPVCTIILTDLICSDFGDSPHYPVLWATTDSTRAPFGDVIEIKD